MRARWKSEAGFTLIEMMVVLILIGLVTVLVVPRGLREAANGAALDTETEKLAGIIRLTREQAMAENKAYRFFFDEGKYYYVITESGSESRLKEVPVDKRVKVSIANASEVIFKPSGTADEQVEISLQSSSGTKKLTVYPQGIIEITER